MASVPIYEFQCKQCENRFEELIGVEASTPGCPRCGSARVRRRLSAVAPPGRQPRGAGVKADESRRCERELTRAERLAETKRKRTAGEH
jgi:putative FmdB family regulatory protein